jgi:peptidyl-prolyl cis-trans isomerase SurA
VPSLADVPQGSAAPSAKQTAAAKAVTMKPGKKEKIRFGQAPRETLPAATTKTEDAGADNAGTQTVANNASAPPTEAPVGDTTTEQPEAKAKKTRFSAEARQHKKNKGPKVDPFAPPPETKDELATQHQQSQALGLNGDTSKKKKNPHKEGPKRRMSNEKKTDTQPSSASPSTQATAPAATPGQQ